MLVLSRKKDETIVIGDKIELTVIDVQGDYVKIGIKAPRDMVVYRKEIYDEVIQANHQAAQSPKSLKEGINKLKSYPKNTDSE